MKTYASNTTTTIKLKHCHLGQAQVLEHHARFKVVACGHDDTVMATALA
ncbi:MAG: hypothetical protein OXG39_06735 [Chloroflexi bacterium]|nr:hypothetical protein [Chloroflexota bacterium]